jgi:hypothetical protein
MSVATFAPPLMQGALFLQDTLAFLEENKEYTELKKQAEFHEIIIEKGDFPAYCNWAKKTIVLNPSLFQEKIGKIYPLALQSIIFETANFAQREQFSNLVDRIKSLTPDEFVEQYERLEHQSGLAAKAILRGCIEIKNWNKIPMVFVSDRFGPHYLFQQVGRHSHSIWDRYADRFEKNSRYEGIAISEADKPYVLALLDLQLRGADSEPSVSEPARKSYVNLKEYLLKNNVNSSDWKARIDEIERSFQN